jgi:hypothetical protein
MVLILPSIPKHVLEEHDFITCPFLAVSVISFFLCITNNTQMYDLKNGFPSSFKFALMFAWISASLRTTRQHAESYHGKNKRSL